MKTKLLIIICFISALLIPVNSIQALPEFLNCTYDSYFVISTNKLEFVPDETFVLNVKTVQNDGVFEIVVIDPKGKEVFADVVDADKNDYAQTRFHIPDDALKGTWSVFVTASPSHKQEVIFIGVDETPQPTLSIKPSFVNHKYKIDDASFLLAGKPNTDIQVNVLGPNDEMMHVYIVTLTLEGKCNFVLDLDEYKPGVYAVGVSDHTDDATAVFTVGLPTITGAIAVNLFSDSYFFGDDIFVSIHTAPEIDLTIEVKDPSGNLVHQLDATSEKNGTFHTSVHLPEYGKNGTWAITARSGANFDTQEFNITLNPQDVDSARISSGSFSPDKTVYLTPWEDRSPLQQFKDGVDPKVIHCNNDLVLIQKYDGNPACVKEQSIQKLVERGWIGNIIKIEPEIMNAIESASIAKYALEPEFEVQRDIAKEIFKSLRTGEDTPYVSFGLSADRKSLDLYFDKTVFTPEKNETYYQEFIDESFAEVTIPINVIFVEYKGSGDE